MPADSGAFVARLCPDHRLPCAAVHAGRPPRVSLESRERREGYIGWTQAGIQLCSVLEKLFSGMEKSFLALEKLFWRQLSAVIPHHLYGRPLPTAGKMEL